MASPPANNPQYTTAQAAPLPIPAVKPTLPAAPTPGAPTIVGAPSLATPGKPITQTAIVLKETEKPKITFLDTAFGDGATVYVAAWTFTIVLAAIIRMTVRFLTSLGGGAAFIAARKTYTEETARNIKAVQNAVRATAEEQYLTDKLSDLGDEPPWVSGPKL